MSNITQLYLEQESAIKELPWARRAYAYLIMCDVVCENLKSNMGVYNTCKDGLNLCWKVLSFEHVKPITLQRYYDDTYEGNIYEYMQEGFFEDKSLADWSFIFIQMIIQFIQKTNYEIQQQCADSIAADAGFEEDFFYVLNEIGYEQKMSGLLFRLPVLNSDS